MAGVSRGSYFAWMKRGEAGEEPFATFRAGMLAAHAEAEALQVARVAAAAPADWKSAAFLLERLAPERWGPPEERPPDVRAHQDL